MPSAAPTSATRPTASNLNFVAGDVVPNLVIVKVGTGGNVSIFNFDGATDVVADVVGWFPSGQSYTGLTPARLLDTRGLPTVDGLFQGGGPVGNAATLNLHVLGRGGVPLSGVGAVVLNVTAVTPLADGFLTVWPTGEARPTASNLNFVAGDVVPNLVIVEVGNGGNVSIYNFQGVTDVVADVVGWFPSG